MDFTVFSQSELIERNVDKMRQSGRRNNSPSREKRRGNDDGSEGVCKALSCKWAEMRLREAAGLEPHRAPAQRITALNNYGNRAYATLVHLNGNQGPLSSTGKVAKELGMISIVEPMPKTPTLGDLTRLALVRTPGTAHVVGLRLQPKNGEASGHAIATYCSRGALGMGLVKLHFYFFDPNFGEFKMRVDEFTADWLVQLMGRAYRDHVVTLKGVDEVKLGTDTGQTAPHTPASQNVPASRTVGHLRTR